MYVKSLTMKGFKSFASATHLRLEPGITCIVGPNGSGKSNVVDALAWVMGEQGAKSLRGGSMEDVIFAGTSGRPPLGRAEVALTVDNTDGALPIDYTEVTISRTMFRSGGSEYAINGTSCRLLDIQELLSDSGIGREMHVIVGQGQLDAVLRATPEERRGFIEEAAGVLKHRKRKERALRKLEAMEANLTRITDLTGEIRRQLGPLGRQAETARKAAAIQAEVRDARLRLLADDLIQLTSTLEQEVADETALIARRTEVEEGLTRLGGRVGELEAAAEAARPELTRAQDRWYALARLTERLTATGSLASERVRLLREDLADEAHEAGSGASSRDPEELRRRRPTSSRSTRRWSSRSPTRRPHSRPPWPPGPTSSRRMRRSSSASLGSPARSPTAAKAWPGWPDRWRPRRPGSRPPTRSSAGCARPSRPLGPAPPRPSASSPHWSRRSPPRRRARRTSTRDTSRPPPTSTGSKPPSRSFREQERAAERDRHSAAARVEGPGAEPCAARTARHRCSRRATTRIPISGSVAAVLQVEAGHEVAVAAALGWAGDALAVDTLAGAAAAVGRLRSDDAGRAGLLVPETAGVVDRSGWPSLPSGARWALDAVTCSERLRPAVDRLLERVALVDGVDAAASLARDGITAVTVDGDVFGPGWVRGGSAARPQPHRDPGGRRRGPRAGRGGVRTSRADPVRHGRAPGPGWSRRPTRSSPPSTSCTTLTRRCPRSPRSSALSGSPSAVPGPRPSAPSMASPRPRPR